MKRVLLCFLLDMEGLLLELLRLGGLLVPLLTTLGQLKAMIFLADSSPALWLG